MTELHVYIITTEDELKKGYYKIGKHTGDWEKLRKRYCTALPGMIQILFYKTRKASEIEKEIKRIYKSNRRLNTKGRMTEWYKIDSEEVKKKILSLNKTVKVKIESDESSDSTEDVKVTKHKKICTATTTKGKKCRRTANHEYNGYCSLHYKMQTEVIEISDDSMDELNDALAKYCTISYKCTCIALTSKGNQCKKVAKHGIYCTLHYKQFCNI